MIPAKLYVKKWGRFFYSHHKLVFGYKRAAPRANAEIIFENVDVDDIQLHEHEAFENTSTATIRG